MLAEHAFGHVDHLDLGVVVVADGTSVEDLRDAVDLGEGRGKQATGAGLGYGECLA